MQNIVYNQCFVVMSVIREQRTSKNSENRTYLFANESFYAKMSHFHCFVSVSEIHLRKPGVLLYLSELAAIVPLLF